ncbi:amino acid ABC transporter permease [Desulfothermus sp.]
MLHSLEVVISSLPYVLGGAVNTVAIVVGAMACGFFIGLPLSLVQVYGNNILKFIANIYVWFFRGVPVLVLLFLFYFGLFTLIDLNISAFWSAVLVLGLRGGAYQSQIFRGSIQSIPDGQLKAAKALGMTDAQGILFIILPQVIRISLPGWSNEYSIVLKDSAIAFVLGTSEIMSRTHFVASRTYEQLAMYLCAGVIYFILTWAGVYLLKQIENKLKIPGYTI